MSYQAIDLEAGTILFRRGDEGRLMYLVKSGEVEVLADEHDETPIAVLERGDFFGEMAVLEREPRSHAVRARIDTKLVEIDANGFAHMLLRNPEIAVRMIRKLARRVGSVEERLIRAWSGRAVTGDSTLSARAKRVARLVVLDGNRDARMFPLAEVPELTIGRADPNHGILPDIDLTAVDTQVSISRRHARLVREGRRLSLVEVRATNGTFVNGVRLLPDHPQALFGGEELRFGGVRMRYEAS